jgi:queuosine precursor transporter
MSTAAPSSDVQPTIARSLFVFALLYGGMTCIAGVLGNKQVELGPLAVEAGIFGFLLLVVLASAVAELFGRDTANKLVLIGFVPLIVSMALILIVLSLPASPSMEPERLSGFQLVLGQSPRLMIGGIIAYGTSQLLNVTIFSALKRPGGRLLWFRAALASVLSQIVDTFLFISIAFYGVFPIGQLLLGQMLTKVVLSVVLVPPLIYLFVAIGRRLDAKPLSSAS